MVGIAKTYGLRVHLDGARIFNAAVALKVDPRVLTEGIDSVSFCLSKGLSAPVGSLVVGNEAFIKKAREVRKLIGGSMRQAGIIAAAGIVALKTMIDRLEEDHQKARLLDERIVTHTPIRVDMKTVQTNIVVADITPRNFDGKCFGETY